MTLGKLYKAFGLLSPESKSETKVIPITWSHHEQYSWTLNILSTHKIFRNHKNSKQAFADAMVIQAEAHQVASTCQLAGMSRSHTPTCSAFWPCFYSSKTQDFPPDSPPYPLVSSWSSNETSTFLAVSGSDLTLILIWTVCMRREERRHWESIFSFHGVLACLSLVPH